MYVRVCQLKGQANTVYPVVTVQTSVISHSNFANYEIKFVENIAQDAELRVRISTPRNDSRSFLLGGCATLFVADVNQDGTIRRFVIMR